MLGWEKIGCEWYSKVNLVRGDFDVHCFHHPEAIRYEVLHSHLGRGRCCQLRSKEASPLDVHVEP